MSGFCLILLSLLLRYVLASFPHQNLLVSLKVVLQTYIEYLRGKLEVKKEMNHHGKSVVVETDTKLAPVE